MDKNKRKNVFVLCLWPHLCMISITFLLIVRLPFLLQCFQPYDSWVISSLLYTELIEYSDSTEYKLPSKWTIFFLSCLVRGNGTNSGFPNLKLIKSLQCCTPEQKSWLILLKTIALRGVKLPALPYSFYSLFYVRKVGKRGWYKTQDQHCCLLR